MRYLKTTKALLKEAKAIQKEFIKLDTYWSLVACLEVLINSDYVKINSEAINGAMIEAKKIDEVIEESIA